MKRDTDTLLLGLYAGLIFVARNVLGRQWQHLKVVLVDIFLGGQPAE